MGERNFIQMVLVTWPRWLPCPYMIKQKTLKISGTKKPMTLKVGMQHWLLEYYQLCSIMILVGIDCLILRHYGKVNFGPLSFCIVFFFFFFFFFFLVLYGKDLQETFEASEGKFETYSQINEYMTIYDNPRSRSFIHVCPRSLRLNIS